MLKTSRFVAACIRGALYAVIVTLPIVGSACFFDMTKPGRAMHGNFRFHSFSRLNDGDVALSPAAYHGARSVALFRAVSAEIRSPAQVMPSAQSPLTATDAQSVLADAAVTGFSIGFKTEFLTRNRHRVALRIVDRAPLLDQAIPDNDTLSDVEPASTIHAIRLVWGQWLYTVEIEDKGLEPEVAVQKSL